MLYPFYNVAQLDVWNIVITMPVIKYILHFIPIKKL